MRHTPRIRAGVRGKWNGTELGLSRGSPQPLWRSAGSRRALSSLGLEPFRSYQPAEPFPASPGQADLMDRRGHARPSCQTNCAHSFRSYSRQTRRPGFVNAGPSVPLSVEPQSPRTHGGSAPPAILDRSNISCPSRSPTCGRSNHSPPLVGPSWRARHRAHTAHCQGTHPVRPPP
ncbi:hypothetical protein C8Q77DRAFT_1987 [Trametes polyzona]|nr:hypothetical protein C8Q77DRAFT_1987 [Trametes polyzona]